MNLTSVNGKNWKFKKFNSDDIKKYEPRVALDGGSSGLEIIDKVIITSVWSTSNFF